MKKTRNEQILVEIESQTKILEDEKASFREFQRVEIQKEEDSKKQMLIVLRDIVLKEELQENPNMESYKRKPFVDSPSHLKIINLKRKIAELQTELH